jgi:hypothetical protein
MHWAKETTQYQVCGRIIFPLTSAQGGDKFSRTQTARTLVRIFRRIDRRPRVTGYCFEPFRFCRVASPGKTAQDQKLVKVIIE